MPKVRIHNVDDQIVHSIECYDYITGSQIREEVSKVLETSYLTFTLPLKHRVLHSTDRITPIDKVRVSYQSWCSIL